MGSEIAMRTVEDGDLPLLETWLRKERIIQWYDDADEWLGEIRGRDGKFAFLHHFIVMADSAPIGFGQWYDCFDAQEEWYTVLKPGEMFSIDYLIGEEDYLGRGYGKAIVKALVEQIKRQQPAAQIVVQPESENTASVRALLANGFVYDEDKKYFLLTE
jgi:RimJ/RimL family protein N-acetyltransferase